MSDLPAFLGLAFGNVCPQKRVAKADELAVEVVVACEVLVEVNDLLEGHHAE